MIVSRETFDKLERLHAGMTVDGKEVNDPNPLFLPAMKKPLTLQEQIKRVLRTEISQQAAHQGLESWEDANDFDVEDDFDSQEADSKYVYLEEETPIERPKGKKTSQKKVEKVTSKEETPESPKNSGVSVESTTNQAPSA